MTIGDLSALLHKQCFFCWHLAGGAWLTFVAVTEPQERNEIQVMRVSTITRHTEDSENSLRGLPARLAALYSARAESLIFVSRPNPPTEGGGAKNHSTT